MIQIEDLTAVTNSVPLTGLESHRRDCQTQANPVALGMTTCHQARAQQGPSFPKSSEAPAKPGVSMGAGDRLQHSAFILWVPRFHVAYLICSCNHLRGK